MCQGWWEMGVFGHFVVWTVFTFDLWSDKTIKGLVLVLIYHDHRWLPA